MILNTCTVINLKQFLYDTPKVYMFNELRRPKIGSIKKKQDELQNLGKSPQKRFGWKIIAPGLQRDDFLIYIFSYILNEVYVGKKRGPQLLIDCHLHE